MKVDDRLSTADDHAVGGSAVWARVMRKLVDTDIVGFRGQPRQESRLDVYCASLQRQNIVNQFKTRSRSLVWFSIDCDSAENHVSVQHCQNRS